MGNKLKAVQIEKDLTARDFYEALGMDKSDFSKVVNGKFFPTGTAGEIMLSVAGKEHLNDLLPDEELAKFLGLCKKPLAEPKERNSRPNTYNLSVRLPRSRCNLLQQQENLHRLGYINLTDWVWQNYLRFERQLNKLDKKERRQRNDTL